MIDSTQVKRVAELARLRITDEEVQTYTTQLDAILDYMEHLDAVSTQDVEPTAFVVPRHKPFNDDTPRASFAADTSLANAPKRTDDYFAVPKVIRQ
jgi:aspartyl-tRNA(Asn)/glutamyl-tRNA(Gln) amidotransferase subunit C